MSEGIYEGVDFDQFDYDPEGDDISAIEDAIERERILKEACDFALVVLHAQQRSGRKEAAVAMAVRKIEDAYERLGL